MKKMSACVASMLYVTTLVHSYLVRTNVRISMTKASVWKESMNNVLFSHRFLERKELLMWSTVPLHCQTFFLFLCMLQRPQSTPSSRHDDITPALTYFWGDYTTYSEWIYSTVHSTVYIWDGYIQNEVDQVQATWVLSMFHGSVDLNLYLPTKI